MSCKYNNSLYTSNLPENIDMDYIDPEEHYFELQVSWYNTERDYFLTGDEVL